jgi:hypothetical protein
MSYINSIVDCPKLQVMLDDAWASPTARLKEAEKHPQLAFTLSPQNRAGADIRISEGRAKVRTVEVVYEQRLIASDVDENLEHGCDATGSEEDKVATYDMNTDLNIGVQMQIDPKELIGSCEETTAYIARKLNLKLAGLRLELANRVASDVVADLGGWASDVENVTADSLIVQAFIDNQTYRPNPSLWTDLDMALMLSQFGESGIFGNQVLVKALRAAAVGGVADFGMNIRETLERYGKGVMYDRAVTTALTASGQDAFAQALGAAQVAFWNKYADPAYPSSETSRALVIYDPVYEYPIDLRIHWDCDILNVKAIVTHKTITLPTDMFKAGDRMEGVVGLAGITVDNCATPEPCPTEG